jgi:hypothetical protein
MHGAYLKCAIRLRTALLCFISTTCHYKIRELEVPIDTMPTPQVPHISEDNFHYAISTSPSSAQSSSPIVIYLISGNPGLIGYYHTFLSLLSENIKSQAIRQEQKCTYHVYGHSLAGFELEERASDDAVPHARYYELEEQIRFVQNKLDTFIATLTGISAGASSNPKPKVILIGHSVGSYIAMETLRRHRDRTKSGDSPIDFDIIGGAMLFPTVVDIAKSPSGQKLTVRALSSIPPTASLPRNLRMLNHTISACCISSHSLRL